MSRLSALHIPFVSGHNDAIDPRVMPDGVFTDVRNGRLRKTGSLAVRRGWRPLTMTEMVTANEFVAHDLYSFRGSLVALGTLGASAAQYLATNVESSLTRPWRAYRDSPVPPVTRVRSISSLPDMSMDVWSTSYALTSSGLFGLAMYQHTDEGPADALFRVFRTDTDQTVAFITDGPGISQIFPLGVAFGRVRLQDTSLVYSVLNPTDSNPTFQTVATLETGVTANSPFEVAVARDTTPTHLHVVVVDGGAATYRRYDVATGVQSGSDKTVAASDVTTFPAVATDEATVRVLTKADTGNVLSVLTFSGTGSYTTTAGPSPLFSSVEVAGSRFCVGISQDLSYIAAQAQTQNDVLVEVLTTSHTLTDSWIHRASLLVSGWVCSSPYVGIGISREQNTGGDTNGTFCLTDQTGPWLWSQFGTSSNSPDAADVDTSARVAVPGHSLEGRVLTGGYGFGTFLYPFTLLFHLNSTARRPGVVFGDTLYIAGGVLTQWSGNNAVDNGIPAPVITSRVASNGSGSLTEGQYSYRAVVTWFDEIRGLHRSTVSFAEIATVDSGEDTVTVKVAVAKTPRRNPNVGSNPTVTLFRTEVGPGELFYQTEFSVVSVNEDSITLVDTTSDADLISAPRLYTEGEFGAVSGVLDIATPRPGAYIAAMRDRIVLGSEGSLYQVSQTLLPEEPVAFAEPGVSGPVALSYFDSVEGRLTSVATLDDTIVLGTADGIFLAGGEGPNLAGVGQFQSPARLPSDVGIHSHVSVIETSEGLWFLGSDDKLYLLPRGGGVPQFAGEAVQGRFTDVVVGSARETEDAIVAWAVGGDGSSLVVHDIDHGYWFADDPPFVPIALTTHEGRMFAVAQDGVVWEYAAASYGDGASGATAVTLQATTGHVQVFGLTGQGRIASIEVLGEVVTAATIQLEISYDDAITWTSLGSYDIPDGAGETFQRQFYPANQRGGRFRLRFTMTSEVTADPGCRLTGFTVYYRTANGPSRLPSASRK